MFKMFIFGAIIASYMYQLTGVKKVNFHLLTKQSVCESCYTTLKPIDLIPVVSYVALRGKCRYCKKRIPISLLICEVLFGILFLIPILSFVQLNPLLYYFSIIFLIPLSIYDFHHFVIPNHMLIIMLVCSIYLFGITVEHFFYALFIILILHVLYFVSKGGLGYGDIKLFSLLSLILPVSHFILYFMFTFIFAGILTTLYVCITRNKIQKVQLVPFMTLAVIFVQLFQTQLNDYFLGGYYGY
ncbi:prepilin peptidase [Mammaliicoccus sciuri]|uniref:prepilin peptidase n=1 Tax=Mammaliicoccus sciuri TaxID=1296 RepID=UPI001E385F4F|nr:A24 family peptidase [Mammaliicoccus sciuri]MCD8823623.1 prepilin peptidase [Mammaliicoccus sciuri]